MLNTMKQEGNIYDFRLNTNASAKILSLFQTEMVPVSDINIASDRANSFLSQPRPKRHADPKWYRKNPDFQAYYRYYSSIGYPEGVRNGL